MVPGICMTGWVEDDELNAENDALQAEWQQLVARKLRTLHRFQSDLRKLSFILGLLRQDGDWLRYKDLRLAWLKAKLQRQKLSSSTKVNEKYEVREGGNTSLSRFHKQLGRARRLGFIERRKRVVAGETISEYRPDRTIIKLTGMLVPGSIGIDKLYLQWYFLFLKDKGLWGPGSDNFLVPEAICPSVNDNDDLPIPSEDTFVDILE